VSGGTNKVVSFAHKRAELRAPAEVLFPGGQECKQYSASPWFREFSESTADG